MAKGGRSVRLTNTYTGETHKLEEVADRRRSYQFTGLYGQIYFHRILLMIEKGSGLTPEEIRVYLYFASRTYVDDSGIPTTRGGATCNEAAEYLGLVPAVVRKMAKKLAQHRIFLIADTIGRTIIYRGSPHIIFSGTGEEHTEESARFHLPSLPGREEKSSRRKRHGK